MGNPTCASTEPSTNSTNACTTDWGCTTTSTASYASPNRKCASITSSALLTRVAESTVIFFPIFHVGWRSASSTVAPATRSGVQVRNGPPDAVRINRASSADRRPVRHCSTALCSESIGTISPPPSRAVRVTSSPAITSVSLLASATRLPALRAASVASSPAAPTIAFTTISTSGCVAASTRHSTPSPVPRPVYDTDVGRVEFACQLLEQFGVRMGGERRDAEPLALAPEHLEGRAPDRAGRGQDRDAQAHATPNRRNRPAV